MNGSIRWRVVSDPKLQGMLCVRVVAYWFCCLLSTLVAVGFGASLRQVVQAPGSWVGEVVPYVLPCVAMTLIVLPVLILDTLTLSNRFTGPMRRLSRRMTNVAAGEQPSSVRFRQGDYYQELASAWNVIADQLAEPRHHVPSPSPALPAGVDEDVCLYAEQGSEAEVAEVLGVP